MVAADGNRLFQILVTDDDESCRQSVGEALDREGYGTYLASSGQEAIEVVRKNFVHVLIVDMNMPDMSGLQTIHVISQEISTPLPSILMSADKSRELMFQALSAHLDSFLPKPVDLCALRQTVEDIICRHYLTES